MKKNSAIAFIVLVFIVIGFGYYYLYGPCGSKRVQQFDDQVTAIMGRWYDAISVARSTSRIALAGPMQNLMEIKIDLPLWEVSINKFKAHEKLIKGMDYGVKGVLEFAAGRDDVSYELRYAGENLREYQMIITEIKSCAPFCK